MGAFTRCHKGDLQRSSTTHHMRQGESRQINSQTKDAKSKRESSQVLWKVKAWKLKIRKHGRLGIHWCVYRYLEMTNVRERERAREGGGGGGGEERERERERERKREREYVCVCLCV